MCKYVVVTGGVVSGCGKGVASASLGLLLQMRGLRVAPIKFEPYLNVNAGVLAPREHGEVFLCDDGSETDLDLGTYERVIGCAVSQRNILTSGTVYKELIEGDEDGKYLGQTIQFVPHVCDRIINRMIEIGKDVDVVMVEIGGTVGDIESGPFLEAIRQYKQKHWNDVLVVLVAPILWMPTIKELKTKPLQNAVKEIQSFGLQPDVILCRCDRPPGKLLDKIANLTNVPRTSIFEAPDVRTIYQVPLEFYNRHIDDLIIDKFHFERNGVRIHKYRDLVEKYVDGEDVPEIEVAIVGKYDNEEAYLSLKEAVYHAGVAHNVRTRIRWVIADELENAKDLRGVWKSFSGVHACIVPGGFDKRGVEGKIKAIQYCREKKIPFLGICLGLQCAVIEYARNVCNFNDANSVEFNKDTLFPVIHFVAGQEGLKKKSGTMRLGAYDCELTKDSLAHDLYKKKLISERHRHRYEVNPEYVKQLEEAGLVVSGRNPETGLIEMMEMDRKLHPYFIGTQAHPEFKSRLTAASPLFAGLVAAAVEKKNGETESQRCFEAVLAT